MTQDPVSSDRRQLAREARIKRRQERLTQAIEMTKAAIRESAIKFPTLAVGNPKVFALEVERHVKANRVGINPILIAIILQLIPILIQWFMRDRLGFQEGVDNLARDVAYNSSDCITTLDLNARADQLSAQLDQRPADSNQALRVELSRLEKLIAIIAIMRLLGKFMDWWNK